MEACINYLDRQNQIIHWMLVPGTWVRYYDSFHGRGSSGLVIGVKDSTCVVLWTIPPRGHKRLEDIHGDDLIPYNTNR